MARKWLGTVLVFLVVLGLVPAAGAGFASPPPIEYIEVEIPREVFTQNKEVTLVGKGVVVYQVEETPPGEYVAGAAVTFPAGTTGELIEYQCTNQYAAVAIGGKLYYVPWSNVSLGGYVVHSYIDGVIILLMPMPQPSSPPQQPT